ncbi:MAG: hypothetical protein ABSA46_03330 [Thermodesulfovibrionales bacterium]
MRPRGFGKRAANAIPEKETLFRETAGSLWEKELSNKPRFGSDIRNGEERLSKDNGEVLRI